MRSAWSPLGRDSPLAPRRSAGPQPPPAASPATPPWILRRSTSGCPRTGTPSIRSRRRWPNSWPARTRSTSPWMTWSRTNRRPHRFPERADLGAVSRSRTGSNGSPRRDPPNALSRDLRDRFVVGVVVDECQAGALGGGRDEQILVLHAPLRPPRSPAP